MAGMILFFFRLGKAESKAEVLYDLRSTPYVPPWRVASFPIPADITIGCRRDSGRPVVVPSIGVATAFRNGGF